MHKKIVRICLILLIVISICLTISYILSSDREKNNIVLGGSGIEALSTELKQYSGNVDIAKKGSIDVLAIGNSDLFSGFNPLQLWHEKGITSYAAGASMQNMSSTYYMLEEILKYQKPKVLILELDNFFEERGKDNKAEAKDNTYRTCYPLFRYTPLWNQLKNKSYVQKNSANARTVMRGYYYKTEVLANDKGYSYMGKDDSKREKMVQYTEKYFPKIMQLAQKNNCQVIFLCFPSRTSWNYRKHNTVASYAKKYQVPYLDLNTDDYGTQFNWKTDTRDAGNHLNHSGATKMTKFLGDYLTEHYLLTDHRGNPLFADWDNDYQNYISSIQ